MNEKLNEIYEVGQKIYGILTHLQIDVAQLQNQARVADKLFQDGTLIQEAADGVAANIAKQLFDLIDTAEAEIDEERGGK